MEETEKKEIREQAWREAVEIIEMNIVRCELRTDVIRSIQSLVNGEPWQKPLTETRSRSIATGEPIRE